MLSSSFIVLIISFSSLLTNFLVFSTAIDKNRDIWYRELDYEVHIPENISPTCTSIIVSRPNLKLNLYSPMQTRPQILLQNLDYFIGKKLRLQYYCNIIVFHSLYTLDKNAVQKFLLQSDLLIQLIIVYITGDVKNLYEVKSFRQFSQSKATLVLINRDNGRSAIYNYPLSCNGSLKCGLKGRSLNVGYSNVPPSLIVLLSWDERKALKNPLPPIKVNAKNSPKLILEGLEANFLELLTSEYEMSFTLIPPSDFEFGSSNKKGKYSGKLGQLQRKEVDLVIGGIVANAERTRIGRYSQQLFSNKFILTCLSPIRSPAWDSAIRPFPLVGWSILGLSIMVVAPVSWFITKTHVRLTTGKDSYTKSVWVYYAHATATLLVEPWPKPPGGPASILLAGWFLACLILQVIYSSNFVAHLSIPEAESPIRTLDEAWAQKKQIIVTPNGTFELYLKNSLDPKLKELYKHRVQVTQNTDATFELIDSGLLATMNSNLMLYKLSKLPKHSREKYHPSNKPILTVFSAWLFSHGHQPLERKINAVILRAAAAGLFAKWQQEMKARMSTQSTMDESAYRETLQLALDQQSEALSLNHLRGVFVFYILGTGLGILVYILEHLKYSSGEEARKTE